MVKSDEGKYYDCQEESYQKEKDDGEEGLFVVFD